jgi:hypothetical protein
MYLQKDMVLQTLLITLEQLFKLYHHSNSIYLNKLDKNMLSLKNIKPTAGSRKTSKRLGRGNASGKGTTCGRGANGQNSRSGGGTPSWFE